MAERKHLLLGSDGKIDLAKLSYGDADESLDNQHHARYAERHPEPTPSGPRILRSPRTPERLGPVTAAKQALGAVSLAITETSVGIGKQIAEKTKYSEVVSFSDDRETREKARLRKGVRGARTLGRAGMRAMNIPLMVGVWAQNVFTAPNGAGFGEVKRYLTAERRTMSKGRMLGAMVVGLAVTSVFQRMSGIDIPFSPTFGLPFVDIPGVDNIPAKIGGNLPAGVSRTTSEFLDSLRKA